MRANVSGRRMGGFTVIEMMVVVAIIAILSMLAVPSMRDMITTQRVKTASFDMFAGLVLARSEAIKRNSTVTMTPGASGWVDGWTVTDSGGNMVGKQDKWTQVAVVGPGTVSFNGMGRLVGPATQFQLSSDELANDKWRCLKLDISGRPMSIVGGCP